MRFILLGPPGVGKGTQSQRISEYYNIPHISTGDILRDNIARKTELGVIAKKIIDDGNFVSDEIALNMIYQRLQEDDTQHGYIFDGFPRTLSQAEKLEESEHGIDTIINFILPDEACINRLSGRMTHQPSGRTYHITDNPPMEKGLDDITKEPLTKRKDDECNTIIKRMDIFHDLTDPVIDYYERNHENKFTSINADQSVDEVFENVKYACKDMGKDQSR